MSKIAKKVVDVEAGLVRLEYADGVAAVQPLADLPREMVNRLALHGLSQKLGDSYAGANDKGWSIQDCRNTADQVWANLVAGVFNAGGGSGGGILAEALSALTGRSVDECSTVINGMKEAARKELRKRPDVKAEVLRIQAERATAKADATPEADTDDLNDLF